LKKFDKSGFVGAVAINVRTNDQLRSILLKRFHSQKGSWIVTANLDVTRVLHRSSSRALLADVLSDALVTADGAPISLLATLDNGVCCQRIPGSELIYKLPEWFSQFAPTIVLAGGPAGHAALASEALAAQYPLCAFQAFEIEQAPSPSCHDLENLLYDKPQAIVFIGLGTPKQDFLINDLRMRHPQAIFVGCGAALSFVAGEIPRAPVWIQKLSLEWFFRFLTEPKRLFKRYFLQDVPFLLMFLVPKLLISKINRSGKG
jgi:N-acetylglucosaminyldiphosphoundecaprenol N-acetyl-beta-D-mannosaminyltransferase